MNNIKSIDTYYNGRYFRSRTEARWAVFFDHLEWKYEYECEGFDLPNVGRYLPDFYFPDINYYAEVKGGKFTELETKKCVDLSNYTGADVIFLEGNPDFKAYDVTGVGGGAVMMAKCEKFYPLFYTYDFDKDYHEITTMAVEKALSKRFEFQNK